MRAKSRQQKRATRVPQTNADCTHCQGSTEAATVVRPHEIAMHTTGSRVSSDKLSRAIAINAAARRATSEPAGQLEQRMAVTYVPVEAWDRANPLGRAEPVDRLISLPGGRSCALELGVVNGSLKRSESANKARTHVVGEGVSDPGPRRHRDLAEARSPEVDAEEVALQVSARYRTDDAPRTARRRRRAREMTHWHAAPRRRRQRRRPSRSPSALA